MFRPPRVVGGIALAAVLTVGCMVRGPSPAVSPTGPVQTLLPTSTATPDATPMEPWVGRSFDPDRPWDRYAMVAVPGGIPRISLPEGFRPGRGWDGFGRYALVTDTTGDEGPFGNDLYLADAVTGVVERIVDMPRGLALRWPTLDGKHAAWMEQTETGWRVRVLELETREFATIVEGGGEPSFVVAMDGDNVVVARRGPSTDVLESWRINDPQIVRTIPLAGKVYQILIRSGTWFFSAGDRDHQGLFTDATAWLIRPNEDAPTLIAKHAYEIGFDGALMAWISDRLGGGYSNQLLVAPVEDPGPIWTVSPRGQTRGVNNVQWPSVTRGLVAFDIRWAGPSEPYSMVAWRQGHQSPVGLEGTKFASSTKGGGEYVWVGQQDWERVAWLSPIRTDDLAAAIGS